MTDEPYNAPLISEAADPLTHLTGNEYELGWRSVWILTPRGNKIRVLETPEGYIETTIQPPRAFGGHESGQSGLQSVGDSSAVDPDAEPPYTISA